MKGTTRSVAEWARAAGAPFAWLGLAVLLASSLALGVQLALGAGPDAGAWNPTWGFVEVRLPEVDAPAAQALVEDARLRHPERHFEWRAGQPGSWIVLVGPEERQALLATLRGAVEAAGHAPTELGFGSNLARVTARVLDDPGALSDALRAWLPLTLFGGALVFLLLGAALRRRLRRDAPPAGPGTRSLRGAARRAAAGVALGLLLVLGAQGVSAVWSALGHPVVEQPWVARVVERGGAELLAMVLLIVLAAPLAEEVFFRGYLLEALRDAWGNVGSLALSSVAFAGIHGHGPALPVYLLYGVGLGLAARRSGGLLVPICAHVTVNAVALAQLV